MESVEEKKPKNDGEKPKFVARTPTDIQRIRLERLMKNPVCVRDEYLSQQTIVAFCVFIFWQQKEVVIPSSSSRKNGGDGFGDTPSFVRNVMGSSAGAGSGEFHVYRHLRRKEYARQKQLQQQSVKVTFHFVCGSEFEFKLLIGIILIVFLGANGRGISQKIGTESPAG